ncbi:MAG: hypothetical protein ACOYI9_09490 [Candidatus Hydrogenedentales bacterium]
MSSKKQLGLLSLCILSVLFLAGCNVDAIWVSRAELNFERDTSPMYFDVANASTELGTIDIHVKPNKNWILVSPDVVPSEAPSGGILVRNKIEVRIDRSLITKEGENEGNITLSAPGVKSVSIRVKVVQDQLVERLDKLNIQTPVVTYSDPYLVELAFSLRDGANRSVTGEPAQFQVYAWENELRAVKLPEDKLPVGPSHGLLMQRGAARQLWMEVILDYSAYMRNLPNAIDEMENAVTDMLLPELNEDVFVGVSGFYRDNLSSSLLIPFTMNHAYVADKIKKIRAEQFSGWASGSRIYDALAESLARFSALESNATDEKYIVLFCNGIDTSSSKSASSIISTATDLGVRIVIIILGDTMEAADLITVALGTGGRAISAASIEELHYSFQRVVEDLSGQYVIRWASLRRDDKKVTPSITLIYGNAEASWRADKSFRARDIEGDPLRGKVVLMQSDTPDNSTVFLRAAYVPNGIEDLRLHVQSAYPFTTSVVSASNDGLLANWTMDIEDDGEDGQWITLSGSQPLPFASFGAMLRFDFAEAVDDPFTLFEIDESIYFDGQDFILVNY